MKLCFIGDARSIHVQRWVRWFAARHEVILIPTAAAAALEEFQVCTLPSESPAGLRLLRSLRAIRGALALHRPDVLHSHYINEAGWLGAASRRHPLVITAWGSDVFRAPRESRLARRLNPWAVRRADCVTCDSSDQARAIRSWGVAPERIAVIGWGVDRVAFRPDRGVGAELRARLGIPPEARVLLSPRQWLPNSNIETVIAAHARLPRDVYLVLKRLPAFEHGGGAAVERAIAASPAAERIRVVGEIGAEELPRLYAAADVVASLCTTDGTPASVLEAMAVGCPVVALLNPSLAEWVEEPGGRLVSSLDPELVAQAASRFLEDDDARERAAAFNVSVVAERADRETEFRRMDEIYARLTAGEHEEALVA